MEYGASQKGRESSGGGKAPAVEWQPDGLPRLPNHLSYEHYDADSHCPVCSLDEGGMHRLGRVASHARALLHVPEPSQPPLRTIDRLGLALVNSLRRPKHPPRWWGHRFADRQQRYAELLESTSSHYIIIGFTILDLTLVVTELILTSIHPDPHTMPHSVHKAEEALRWSSVGILCLFCIELLARLAVFGYTYFTGSLWHLFDAAVIVSSLALELSLHNIAREVASLLIFLRLWRILRVMHGVAEAMELHVEAKLERHHRLVHGLQKDLAAQRQQVRQLEGQLQALAAAAEKAGVDVGTVLRRAMPAPESKIAHPAVEALPLQQDAALADRGGNNGPGHLEV